MQGDFNERRHAPRTKQKQPVEIRPFDPQLPPEDCTTLNISESGLYFETSRHYTHGANLYATGEFQPGSLMNRSIAGSVVRVEELESGMFGVAIQIHSSG